MEKDLLSNYGIDFEKGLKYCMGNRDFYLKILSMFMEDSCFQRAKAAYTEKDYRKLFNNMHELKGVSGNAALVALYNTTVPLVELLRIGNNVEAQVDALFAAIEASYDRTCEGIKFIIAGS